MLVLLLSGCRDYNELNMQELVNHAGVDFENGEVSVCVLCDGGKEEKPLVRKSVGESFFEAVREMSGRSDKKLYWGHTETVVFGEAASFEAFPQTLDAILRARDVFSDVVPVAVRGGKAEDVLSSVSGEGAPNILEAFANSGNSRRFEALPLWKLLRSLELYGACVIPTVVKEGEKYILSGGAVMTELGRVGYLSEEQMLLRSLLTDKTAGGYLPTIRTDDGRAVSFEILANDLELSGKESSFTIRNSLTLSPAEVLGSVSEEEMKSLSEEYLTRSYRELIAFCKTSGFGNVLNLRGAKGNAEVEVLPDVKISNVLGGR